MKRIMIAGAALCGLLVAAYVWVASRGDSPPPNRAPIVPANPPPSTNPPAVKPDLAKSPPEPRPDAANHPADGGAPTATTEVKNGAENQLFSGWTQRAFNESDRERLQLPAEVKGGIVVLNVEPRSSANEARLMPDDVIVRAQRTNVTTMDELRSAVGDRTFTIVRAYRKGKPFEVVLQTPTP